MEMTDIQTDRLTIIHVSSVEIRRTRNGKCTKNDTTTTRNRPCYVGHCSNRLHRKPRYMYRYIWIETRWFLMKKTDRKGNQAHRQTDRLSIIGVSLVAICPTTHKRQRHANHTTSDNNQHRGPTTHRMGMVRLEHLSGTASTLIWYGQYSHFRERLELSSSTAVLLSGMARTLISENG